MIRATATACTLTLMSWTSRTLLKAAIQYLHLAILLCPLDLIFV